MNSSEIFLSFVAGGGLAWGISATVAALSAARRANDHHARLMSYLSGALRSLHVREPAEAPVVEAATTTAGD